MSTIKNRIALVALYLLTAGTASMVATTGDGAPIPAVFFILAQIVFISVMARGWRVLGSTGRGLSTVLLLVTPLSLVVAFTAVRAFPGHAREHGHELSGGSFSLFAVSFIALTCSALGAAFIDHRALNMPLMLMAAASALLMALAQLAIIGQVAKVHAAAVHAAGSTQPQPTAA